MLAALSVGFLSLSSPGAAAGAWGRFFYDNQPGKPFVLASIGYANHALSATGVYRYVEGRDPVRLRGKNVPGGMFQPFVAYEVAIEGKTKWRTLRAEGEQSDFESITVSPDNPVADLYIDMEPFRGCIGIYRYGRLRLPNSDAVILQLDDLLPTADASDESGNFKEDDLIQTDEERKKQGFTDAWLAQPADLSSLTALGGRLSGDFWFKAKSAETVSLEGTRTADGDFWPRVILQAANIDGAWETIGQSNEDGVPGAIAIPSGKAERLRVLLTDYKPLIDKYKFGRIVFSNGEAAVFSIDLLTPKISGNE